MSSPIPYDPIAIASYHSIAREMLAAYPSEYNILGALFNVIKGIGSTVLPAILPSIGNLFGTRPEQVTAPAYSANPVRPQNPGEARPSWSEPARQPERPQIVYVDRPRQEERQPVG